MTTTIQYNNIIKQNRVGTRMDGTTYSIDNVEVDETPRFTTRRIITDIDGNVLQESPVQGKQIGSDGGPSNYYDFPESWNTQNDYIESKSKYQWKEYSFHLGNISKALTRWGDKAGTTIQYDAKKIVYSACRVLMMIAGVQAVRDYLQSLLDDPQFKGKKG